MANRQHLEIVIRGVCEWNAWRKVPPAERPDLGGAELGSRDVHGIDFWNTDLYRASLWKADLADADLSNAYCGSVALNGANLRRGILTRTNLRFSRLVAADVQGATICGA